MYRGDKDKDIRYVVGSSASTEKEKNIFQYFCLKFHTQQKYLSITKVKLRQFRHTKAERIPHQQILTTRNDKGCLPGRWK